MLGENFVYFFTVQGFFAGIIFGILKSFGKYEDFTTMVLKYAAITTCENR